MCMYDNTHLYDTRNSPSFRSTCAGRHIVRFHDSLSEPTKSILGTQKYLEFHFY